MLISFCSIYSSNEGIYVLDKCLLYFDNRANLVRANVTAREARRIALLRERYSDRLPSTSKTSMYSYTECLFRDCCFSVSRASTAFHLILRALHACHLQLSVLLSRRQRSRRQRFIGTKRQVGNAKELRKLAAEARRSRRVGVIVRQILTFISYIYFSIE